MKTKLSLLYLWSFIFGLALCTEPSALSQIPQGFNYQAIARDGSGNPIANTSLPVRITIQADSLGTTILWQEVHASVTSNSYGLINLVIGRGARQASSTVALFSNIDWTVTPKFIKTEIFYDTDYLTMGVSRLWSVPYATVAGNLAGSVKKLSVEGETSLYDEALFEVKNKNGQTIFAVYNEGVRIYVDDGAKGPKGGFAVGGFDMNKATKREYFVVSDDSVRIYLDSNPLTKGKKSGFAVGGYDMTKGDIQNYLDVSADSVRIYIDSDPATKKVKGGFAVGGYDMTKAPVQEYLRVTSDSTRVNVNNNPAKGLKGGFAVGGFDATKGPATLFTSLTPKNYFIGHEGGMMITSGQYNSIIGYQSGKYITTGESNAFLGYQAGYANTTGTGNLFLGYQSGSGNLLGNYNTFMGYLSGNKNTSGTENTFAGSYSGNNNTTGNNNTFIGYFAGYSNVSGNGNIFEGTRSGYSNTIGEHNLFLGTQSGQDNVGGNYNIFLGYQSGNKNTSGSSNTFIGRLSGYTNTVGGNNVFLGNSAGYSTSASYNVFVGYETGYLNTSGNTNSFIGYQAGYNNTTGNYNTFLGYQAGKGHPTLKLTGSENVYIGYNSGLNNTTGGTNTFLGYYSGASNTEGINNVFVGSTSGLKNSTGGANTFVGNGAGGENKTGSVNTAIGVGAGTNNVNGSNNVFLGSFAGYNETGNNKLYISNTNSDPANTLIYGEFDNKRLYLNANVGIGIAASGYKLHVAGDIYANGGWLRASGSAGLYFETYGGGWYMSDNDWIRAYNNKNIYTPGIIRTDGTLQVGAGTTLSVVNGGNFAYLSNVLFANTSGNVGIGTVSPGYTLDVTGSIRSTTNIFASGGVGIGLTSAPSYSLHISKSTGSYLAGLVNTGNAANANGMTIYAGMEGAGGAYYLRFQRPGTAGTLNPVTIGSIRQNDASSVVYNTTSDMRVKENILPTHFGLADFMKVKVRDFEFIEDKNNRVNTGFIAQELFDVYPLAVTLPNDDEDLWQVDYGRITPLIVKAVQDQQHIIQSQQSQIESQQKQIDELKALLEQLVKK